jgi:hypothetical protein
MIKREDLADQNRLPGFWIGDDSERFLGLKIVSPGAILPSK